MRLSSLLSAIHFPIVAQAQSEQYALTASSSYRMVISQTETELGSVAIRILQEATAEHLLEHSTQLSNERLQPNYRSIEVVVQGSELLEDGENQTRLRFFVLASAQTSSPFGTQAKRQSSLNELIEYSFSRQDRIELFLLRIRVKEAENRDNINTKASIQLQAINTVALFSTSVSVPTSAPLSNSTNSSGIGTISQRRGLSTLDLVLISVSSFILLGIIWMIFIHHLDRGHFENQRIRALHLQQQRSQDEAALKRRRDEEKTQLHGLTTELGHTNTTAAVQLTPSTQSSLSLGSLRKDDVSAFPTLRASSNSPLTLLTNPPPTFQTSTAQVLSETVALHQQQPDQVHYVTSGLTADRSEPAYPSSSDCSSSLSHYSSSMPDSSSHVTLGIAEPFDQNNWFRRPVTPRRSTAQQEGDGQSTGSDGSDDSNDVFQVGVEKAESQSSEEAMDPQAMSEWLSSIHVVPESSSTPTKHGAALEVSSLGHVSLEQSMVSSAVASADKRNSSALSL